MRKLWISFVMLAVMATPAFADGRVKTAAEARADVQKIFGFVPDFIKKMPDAVLPSAWEAMKTLQLNPETTLSGKQKELIGLGVAAQIPCEYCIYAHTAFAKLNGATDAEIGEAVSMAALTRNYSTFLNGIQPDEAKFRAEVGKWTAQFKKMAGGKVKLKEIDAVDAKTVNEDVAQMFGSVPDFIRRYPAVAVAAFWNAEKDLEMGKTNLDEKTKSLIGLAVASQIPCRYCIIADTEFAKMAGTTDAEVSEAIAMSGHVREWSTLLNGMQIDKATFKKDVNRLVKAAQKMAKGAKDGKVSKAPSKKPAVEAMAQ